MNTIPLTPEVFARMGIAAVYPPAGLEGKDERVNSVAFSDEGRFLMSARNDGVVEVFNGTTGAKDAEFHVSQADGGVRCLTATHSELAVVHAPNIKSRDTRVAYHSLHDNKIIRYFTGHKNGWVVAASALSRCSS
jgi:WD40 repeat protein